jgi:activator of HSP90 ATPase
VQAKSIERCSTRISSAPSPTQRPRSTGGAFSGFGGAITGRNIELIADRRIVQAWRVASWPEGYYSIVRFELEPSGAETKLTLHHTGFPEDAGDHLASGWHKMYWEPLKNYLRCS